jgi:uncharacterized protein with NAD-binding domain and iron-sulfur cluster
MIAAQKRVAIVGGGCGGVAAAFWLSATAALRQRYQVTLYTHGWRLGGKGASGRNAEKADRIEEHGLHLWMGCYRRAFQLMRAALAEDPTAGGSLENAFQPIRELTLMERDFDIWKPWAFQFQERDGFPDQRGPSEFHELVVSFATRLERFIHDNLSDRLSRELYTKALRALRDAADNTIEGDPKRAAKLLEDLNSEIQQNLESGLELAIPPRLDAWRMLVLANLGTALAVGVARDILMSPDGAPACIARLDTLEFRHWLKGHGAKDASLAAAPIRALYDLTFAYPNGDTRDPGTLAAGVTLGLVLEMIDYQGAPFWRMNGGMGDAIFAPLYRVLLKRGVRIEFFHRLDEVVPSADGSAIQTATLLRQAKPTTGAYAPFVSVKGDDCWPSQPNWDQLEGGQTLSDQAVDFEFSDDATKVEPVVLHRGAPDGFDHLVLAVPPDTLKVTTKKLTHPRWRTMLETSASTATQAFQLWINQSTRGIGWKDGTLASTYEQPFATWADMSHVLRLESWPGAHPPLSAHYFCGPMRAVDHPNGVPTAVDRWTRDALAVLWPDGARPPNWIVGSYARANTDLSERYVQAPPGSIHTRLAPDEAPYSNLSLAGDWTRLRYSGGCVENAVESGLLAARHICGDPQLGGD